MLSPSELREKYRGTPLSVTAEDFADLCEQVAALKENAFPATVQKPCNCGQVTMNVPVSTDPLEELRNKMVKDIEANPERYAPLADWKPQHPNRSPRILKASEITEPGEYYSRGIGDSKGGWYPVTILRDLTVIEYAGCSGAAAPLSDLEEYYGPIQLPE